MERNIKCQTPSSLHRVELTLTVAAVWSPAEEPDNTVRYNLMSPAEEPDNTVRYNLMSPAEEPDNTVRYNLMSPAEEPDNTVRYNLMSPAEEPDNTVRYNLMSPASPVSCLANEVHECLPVPTKSRGPFGLVSHMHPL